MSTVSSMRVRTRDVAARGRMPAFYAVTVGFLAFLLFALNEPMRFTVLAWTPGYEFFTHRVHHVMLGSLLTSFVVCVALQLYRPAERVGSYLFAALAVGFLFVTTLVGDGVSAAAELAVFVVPLAVLGLLHPGLRSFRPSRETLDGRMLVLGVLAAVPLVAFAAVQVDLHLTLTDDHVSFGHYLTLAAGTATVGVGVILASFRPVGWRVLAYGAAVLVALVGVASALYTDPVQGTNFGVVGGALAVLWAASYVAVAERGARGTGGLETSDVDPDA